MNNLRVFTSDDFTGRYPVGTAMVVIAINEDEALILAKKSCEQCGLKFDGTLKEIDVSKPDSYILNDGDY